MTKLGVDLFQKEWPSEFEGVRVALLIHSASYLGNLKSTLDAFLGFEKVSVKSVFAPQHGLFGETQDNMIEWEGYRDLRTGIPVYSLYGKARKPPLEVLLEVDGVVVDLQDVGSRYYTYIWSLYLTMEAAMECGKFIVVLDRPNPISGSLVEGPVLKEEFASFVGLKPLPVRHGMTIGEIASYFKHKYLSDLELRVIKMEGWSRRHFWQDTGLDWVNPSPNMPSEKTAILYPGMCLLEATNISEGRGTTRPFEIFGAPFIEPFSLADYLSTLGLDGTTFRPLYFIPTFNKFAGEKCGGVQIHILSKEKVKPFKIGVAVIKAMMELYPQEFRWKQPPYEYEYVKLPFDILVGTDELRLKLERREKLDEMEAWWQAQSESFNENIRKDFLLYD